jgi:co-chaperonin GroES (HSP10)
MVIDFSLQKPYNSIRYNNMDDIMQLYPTQDYVLVEILDREYISEAGLILPEHRKKSFKGKIVAIAAGNRDKNGDRLPIDPDIQIGRTVWFDRFLGTDFEIDDKKIRFIKPDQILCYMGEDEPQDETIHDELDAISDPHSHIPPEPEQVSRETSSFFVQGRTHESADKNASPNCH